MRRSRGDSVQDILDKIGQVGTKWGVDISSSHQWSTDRRLLWGTGRGLLSSKNCWALRPQLSLHVQNISTLSLTLWSGQLFTDDDDKSWTILVGDWQTGQNVNESPTDGWKYVCFSNRAMPTDFCYTHLLYSATYVQLPPSVWLSVRPSVSLSQTGTVWRHDAHTGSHVKSLKR